MRRADQRERTGEIWRRDGQGSREVGNVTIGDAAEIITRWIDWTEIPAKGRDTGKGNKGAEPEGRWAESVCVCVCVYTSYC